MAGKTKRPTAKLRGAQKQSGHALQKGRIRQDCLKNGRTSSRKSLGVSFFKENAAVPTHPGAPSFPSKRCPDYTILPHKIQAPDNKNGTEINFTKSASDDNIGT